VTTALALYAAVARCQANDVDPLGSLAARPTCSMAQWLNATQPSDPPHRAGSALRRVLNARGTPARARPAPAPKLRSVASAIQLLGASSISPVSTSSAQCRPAQGSKTLQRRA
jgi:hypothetical protein